ncbi:MAG: hypothetical protein JEZ08_24845 [Clostridiales bacterium]|nr:hypothetical protein [Clostridiales bacterium]
MSVIAESLENTPIIILSSFVCCKYGEDFSWDEAREFKVGERVFFIDGFEDNDIKQGYLKWQVKFRTSDGNIFSANQLYFATEEVWEGLKKYFIDQLTL